MSSLLLRAEGVRKAYRMGRFGLDVLRSAQLRVEAGEFVAIMGRSGSGKSTLLHVLAALDTPDGGEVTFAGAPLSARWSRYLVWWRGLLRGVERVLTYLLLGLVAVLFLLGVVAPLAQLVLEAGGLDVPHSVMYAHLVALVGCLAALVVLTVPLVGSFIVRLFLTDLSEWRQTRLRRRSFGFVFQAYHLLPELDALDNVALPLLVNTSISANFTAPVTLPFELRRARLLAAEALRRVGLSERLHHRPNELSGGERQRVAIARALVHKPRILFADEPTGNLDAQAGGQLMSLLKELHAGGQTIVLVTHDPSIAQQADRVLHLEEGRLRQA